MSSVYDPDNFIGRVNYAAQCFVRGRGHGLHSRHFDTCFEMGDADGVVTALVRRAQKNPRLYAAIAHDWRGEFPQGWLDCANENKNVPTRQLKTLVHQYD